MSVSSNHRGSLPLPIAEAATVGYFEKATLFKGRAEIRLGDSFARRDGVSFQAAGVTTAVRNYTIENVVLDAETLLLVQGGRVIPETAYFVPEAKRDHLKIEPAALVRLDTHEDVIMGYNNAHWGYQHWLTQCLPAIDWSLRSQRIHRCRLLLPTLAPWQEDFMGILGYGMVPSRRAVSSTSRRILRISKWLYELRDLPERSRHRAASPQRPAAFSAAAQGALCAMRKPLLRVYQQRGRGGRSAHAPRRLYRRPAAPEHRGQDQPLPPC
jgi:hypothetical protein